MNPRLLNHGRAVLALHERRGATTTASRPLLVLHALGENGAWALPIGTEEWPGAVFALDFIGHGQSSQPQGGGYTPELLMADADAALAEIGPATVIGSGLGAYIALMIAGGRPHLVRGAVLCDGPGMAGGGDGPVSSSIVYPNPASHGPPDPFVLVDLSRDVRPADYAVTFARHAFELSDLGFPLWVAAKGRPGWLRAVIDQPGVRLASVGEALGELAAIS